MLYSTKTHLNIKAVADYDTASKSRKFYQCFPDPEIVNSCVHNLTWTYFRSLLRVADENARVWYMNEAAHENWNVRMLDRNISTQYYERLL